MMYLFERDADMDVVWSGKDPLLPERDTKEDGRCEGLARFYQESLLQEAYGKAKRLYHKVNLRFWERRAARLQSGCLDPQGKATIERTGLRGDLQKYLSHAAADPAGRTEEPLCPSPLKRSVE